MLQQGELYKKIFKIENGKTTLISNQKPRVGLGSETTELFSNIRKVRERMVQLKEVLFFKLSPVEQQIAILSISNFISARGFSNEKFCRQYLNIEIDQLDSNNSTSE